ncbi:armadillo (ARM) repeat-containing protein family [Trichomonas vaginalis G3]|nr:armadillo (ARM) repeat-containing protein family [Trichomonas vaginalis G3]KAI5549139.1 armadillo (ARM) repeat-containing protein family [Trichomonas vaginalis G3]
MRLPLQILRPNLDDGSLIVQTKIKTLGYIAKENQEEYVKILFDSLNENNDDRQASCCASLSLCINKLESNLELSQLFAQLVLTKQTSWFKSLNVLNLLSETNANTVEKLVGINGIKKVIGILYDLSFNQNDKVYQLSPNVLSKFIRPKDYSFVLMKIANNIDYFDLDSFRRSINLLTIIVRDHQQDIDLKFFDFLIVSIVEGLDYFKEDLNLISNIFMFLSYFDLSFLSSSQSSSLALFALDIAAAELHLINGQKPDFGNSSTVSELINILDSDLQSKNFDIISGQDTDHESYLSSLFSVVKLFNSLPNDCCYLPSQLNLANALIKIFPHESARLYEKLWKSMTENEQSTILSTISPCLATMKDFGAIAIWAYLLLTKLPDSASRFIQARDVIHKLSYYALQHLEVVPDGVLFVFVRYEATVVAEISTITPLIWQIPENRRNRMLNKLLKDHPDAYRRLMGDQPPPYIAEEIKSVSDNPVLNVEYNVNMSNDFTSDLTSPHIITQLRSNLYEFQKDVLQSLALTYCRFSNNVGLRALLNYATKSKVNLDFNPHYIPHSLLPMVIQYIRIIKDPFGPSFVSECLKLSHSKEVCITSATVIPQTFINCVSGDRITKKGITKVLYAISKVALPKESVFEFVIKCLDPNTPPKRYLTSLTLATVACSLIPKIEGSWIDQIISKLKTNENEINLSVLTRFVYSAVSKVPTNSSLNEFLRTKICENVGKNTLESCISSLSLLCIETNQKSLEKIYDNTQNYLTGITPSLFSTGVKFLNMILTKSKDSSLDSLMKNNKLNQVMQRVSEFDKIPFIHENVVLFYSNIMTRQTLSSYQKLLIKSFDQIIPVPSSPSFPAMSVLIPKLIAGGDQEIQKKCLTFSEKLMTKPASLFLMRCQIQIIREIATKMSTYETFILDRSTEFLYKAHKIDGPSMADILYEYISFITESLGFSDGVQFVVLQFHKYIPRFISLFVALARLYSRVDEEKKKHILSLLPNVLFVNAHKVAIECIGNKHKMAEALKLACYEEDCAESNEIIGRIRKM